MDPEQKTLRVCALVVVSAVLLRLFGGGFWDSTVQALGSPNTASILFFLETGRYIRPGDTVKQDSPVLTPLPQKVEESPDLPVFSQTDAELVEIRNTSGYDVEASALLESSLTWNLHGDIPTVLILHTHGTESYTKTENYTETTAYRTQDTGYNMVSIGDRVTELLENAGIRVIHDRTMHDIPSYNYSYTAARQATAKHLDGHPEIALVLDLHRDSMENENGSQITATVPTSKGESAQLMLVMGSSGNGQNHPNWEKNLSLAAKLHAQLEKSCPGICRPLQLRSQRYNQDLSTGSILVEVGAAGNTRKQALLAAEYLAEAIIALSYGSNYV